MTVHSALWLRWSQCFEQNLSKCYNSSPIVGSCGPGGLSGHNCKLCLVCVRTDVQENWRRCSEPYRLATEKFLWWYVHVVSILDEGMLERSYITICYRWKQTLLAFSVGRLPILNFAIFQSRKVLICPSPTGWWAPQPIHGNMFLNYILVPTFACQQCFGRLHSTVVATFKSAI